MGAQYSLFAYGATLKRKYWDNYFEDDDQSIVGEEREDSTPVRKKLKTVDYIYEHLYVNGENSDVMIKAFNCEWCLHRVYLAQSPYFASMFGGNWRESKLREIHVNFPDRRINADSLATVFASLYRDEINIDPSKVTALLATAVALQLDSVIQQCVDVMLANLSVKTVICYFNNSLDYGQKNLEMSCRKWLENNLFHYGHNSGLLRKLSLRLMTGIMDSPQLYVVQGESDLYMLLKNWTYCRLSSRATLKRKHWVKSVDEYFSSWKQSDISFLESAKGRGFAPVFSRLRLHHILTSLHSYEVLTSDNIIPKAVIDRIMSALWRTQLSVEAAYTAQESGTLNLTDDEFDGRAIRCGRVLHRESTPCWRWSGYFFGVDILVSYARRVITVKRNCYTLPCPYSVNLKSERKLCYKLSVVRLNDKRQPIWSHETGLQCLTLKCDASFAVATIPANIEFPLMIIFKFMVIPCVPDYGHQALPAAWEPYLQSNEQPMLISDESSDD